MKFKFLIVLKPLFVWILFIPVQLLANHTFEDFGKHLNEGVTHYFTLDSVLPPWNKIDLTSDRMKTGYPFVVAGDNFPWIPVVVGTAVAGTAVYLLVNDDGSPPDACSFTISAPTVNSTCGLANGSANILTNPPDDYTYAWSNGATSSSISELSAGTYTVTVTKTGTTCSETLTVNISNTNPSFDTSISTTDADCGQNNGTANVAITPEGSYTYQWSNGSTEQNQTSLTAGQYGLTVSAGVECVNSYTAQIGEVPFNPGVNITITSSHCGLADGTAIATVDPPGDYTIAWSNGQSGPEATGLGAGEYTVSVSISGTSCTQTTTFTVVELPTEHTVNVTTTPAACGVNDGTAMAIVNPPGDYTIAWSNGQSGPEVTDLIAGQHTVSVSVPGSSCLVIQEFVIGQTSGNFTGTVSIDDSSCGFADGTATVTIDPKGEYTYAWSNGQSAPVADMLSPGTYTLVVTDTNQCTVEFSATIGQDTADYISIVSTIPGTCIGGGDITFTLMTTGSGPLVFQADGPNGTTTQTLASGTYQLSAFIPVSSGSHTLSAYDQTIGPGCIETVNTNIADNTPALTSEDDFYETSGGVPISGNVLDNDSGLEIEMTSVSEVIGGTVTFLPGGGFDFMPDAGFSGDASFIYTVTDACGTTTTAVVIIFVAASVCDFTIQFTLTPASCGLDDGAIAVEVNEPGSYTYTWSHGDSGPFIQSLFAGTYSVTIADINLGCDLEFTVDLPENPAEHIDDVLITQPACGVEGEIQFTVSSNSQNPLVMSVDHPNGTDVFFIDVGLIVLSDFISLTAGDYTIEIFDAGAGADCAESLEVTLITTSSLEIFAEAVFPPTEPTAMDGLAIIVVTMPGTLPYEILLNGNSWGVAIDNTFQVGGLEVGEYTIQIIDAEGCVSNVLTIIVPFPDFILSFGTSILQTQEEESNEGLESFRPGSLWRSVVTGSVKYPFGSVYQEVTAKYALPLGDQPGFVEMAYMTDIGRYTLAGVGLTLQGGIGGHFEKHQEGAKLQNHLPTYLFLKASGGYTIARTFKLQAALELRCWNKLELPRLEVGLSIPFARTALRWMK